MSSPVDHVEARSSRRGRDRPEAQRAGQAVERAGRERLRQLVPGARAGRHRGADGVDAVEGVRLGRVRILPVGGAVRRRRRRAPARRRRRRRSRAPAAPPGRSARRSAAGAATDRRPSTASSTLRGRGWPGAAGRPRRPPRRRPQIGRRQRRARSAPAGPRRRRRTPPAGAVLLDRGDRRAERRRARRIAHVGGDPAAPATTVAPERLAQCRSRRAVGADDGEVARAGPSAACASARARAAHV